MSQSGNPRNTPLLIAAGTVVVAAIVAVAVGFNHAANSGVNRSPEPTVSTSAAPTATPAIIPFADCSTQTFGAPLAPLNQPADVHVYPNVPGMSIDTTKLYEATITTANRGAIVICLQPELAPQTVNVFVTLARNHFFDGMQWHRVAAGFVIQMGDPTCTGIVPTPPPNPPPTPDPSKCGGGGPGFSFKDEPVRQHYVLGAVAMANSGVNTNGSQIFIDSADDSSLSPKYNLFGKVVTGMDVVAKVVQGDSITSVTVTEQQ
jgi:cyclophilin family peptidyl-prolyl cis-trans isomerase